MMDDLFTISPYSGLATKIILFLKMGKKNNNKKNAKKKRLPWQSLVFYEF